MSVIVLGALSTLIVTVLANLLVTGPLRQRLLNASVLEFQAAEQCSDPALEAKLRAEARLRLRKYMIKLERTASTIIEFKAVGLMLIPWLPVAIALSVYVGGEGRRFWIWGFPLGLLGALLQIASARLLTRRRAARLEAESTSLATTSPHSLGGGPAKAIAAVIVLYLLLTTRRRNGGAATM